MTPDEATAFELWEEELLPWDLVIDPEEAPAWRPGPPRAMTPGEVLGTFIVWTVIFGVIVVPWAVAGVLIYWLVT